MVKANKKIRHFKLVEFYSIGFRIGLMAMGVNGHYKQRLYQATVWRKRLCLKEPSIGLLTQDGIS